MAREIKITPYKLTVIQKQLLKSHLQGELGVMQTASRMGINQQKLYTMLSILFRHASSTGRIDVKALLKDY